MLLLAKLFILFAIFAEIEEKNLDFGQTSTIRNINSFCAYLIFKPSGSHWNVEVSRIQKVLYVLFNYMPLMPDKNTDYNLCGKRRNLLGKDLS